jgi:hypothetical protein
MQADDLALDPGALVAGDPAHDTVPTLAGGTPGQGAILPA